MNFQIRDWAYPNSIVKGIVIRLACGGYHGFGDVWLGAARLGYGTRGDPAKCCFVLLVYRNQRTHYGVSSS
jgi:hypothetical protein